MLKNLFSEGLRSSIFQYLSLTGNYLFYSLLVSAIGAETYGYYAYALSMHHLLFLILSMGLPIAILRFKKEPQKFSSIASPFIAFTTMLIFISTVMYYLFTRSDGENLPALLVVASISSVSVLLLPLWQWKKQVALYMRHLFVLGLTKVLFVSLIYFKVLSMNIALWIMAGVLGSILIFMIRQLRLFQWNLSFQTSLFRH